MMLAVAVLAALLGDSGESAEPRVVTVHVLADTAYRRATPEWQAWIRRSFELAGQRAGVRFELVALDEWPRRRDDGSLDDALGELSQVPAVVADWRLGLIGGEPLSSGALDTILRVDLPRRSSVLRALFLAPEQRRPLEVRAIVHTWARLTGAAVAAEPIAAPPPPPDAQQRRDTAPSLEPPPYWSVLISPTLAGGATEPQTGIHFMLRGELGFAHSSGPGLTAYAMFSSGGWHGDVRGGGLSLQWFGGYARPPEVFASPRGNLALSVGGFERSPDGQPDKHGIAVSGFAGVRGLSPYSTMGGVRVELRHTLEPRATNEVAAFLEIEPISLTILALRSLLSPAAWVPLRH